MAQVPTYVKGIDWSLTISPCSVDSVGNLTILSSLSFGGRTLSFSQETEFEMANFTAIDQFTHNNVQLGETFTFEVEEMYAKSNGSYLQYIQSLGVSYVFVGATYEGGGPGYSGYFAVTKYGSKVERGVTKATMSLTSAGIALTVVD